MSQWGYFGGILGIICLGGGNFIGDCQFKFGSNFGEIAVRNPFS